jgi:hypothetical protein
MALLVVECDSFQVGFHSIHLLQSLYWLLMQPDDWAHNTGPNCAYQAAVSSLWFSFDALIK